MNHGLTKNLKTGSDNKTVSLPGDYKQSLANTAAPNKPLTTTHPQIKKHLLFLIFLQLS